MHILLYNPNRSAHITERMAASARAELDAGHRLSAVTGAGGPLVVRDAATLRQAEAEAHRALPLLMQSADALLLAISLDAAVDHWRPVLAPHPVRGMTEAAVAAAAGRIGLLTLGPALLPLYRDRLDALVPASRIAGVEAPELALAFEPGEPLVSPRVWPTLLSAGQRLVRSGADSIVLAGAVLCGYDQVLTKALGVPVLDGVRCAMRQLQDAGNS